MKALAVFALAGISLIAGSASADQGSCDAIGILAKSVMSARQGGVPMQDILSNGVGSKKVSELTRLLAMAAYDQPRFSTEEHQERAITEFQNQMYLACLKGES